MSVCNLLDIVDKIIFAKSINRIPLLGNTATHHFQHLMISESKQELNFGNTEIAFADKSNKELKNTARLFRMMNNQTLVSVASRLGLAAVKLHLPFAKAAIKATIFDQFCGGINLMDCQSVVDKLYRQDTLTILDFGAEGKTKEDEFDKTMAETIKAIEFAASNDCVPAVSTKLTGLADDDLLMKMQSDESLNEVEQQAYDRLIHRLSVIGDKGEELGVGIFVDAEESWMQESIDRLVNRMMAEYNKKKVIVYNTYQLYRHDKLDQLLNDFEKGQENGYMIGAKLVRGAYMVKERRYAEERGNQSPIHKNKAAVDADYNQALRHCVQHHDKMGSCNASHNFESNYLQAKLIEDHHIIKNHPHLNFCQLYGMSDNITFNLAKHGYNVAKYIPYGPVHEVVPYLIRRAQENTSMTGDVSRELQLLKDEMDRRGL